MGSQHLLDTNAVIDFAADKLPVTSSQKFADILDETPTISFINKIELLAFNTVPSTILTFVDMAEVIAIDNEIIDSAVNIRKNYRLKLPDAIIGATALVHDLTLITHNIKDFEKIVGLKLVDSYQM